ncbi:MAG: CRISPR-associated endonuclease Cas2 [Chitinophagaceae bacterium]|nr:MAG: CRISPR-associated endonuclease Cas2 [Chitinophagaceae bacterium]
MITWVLYDIKNDKARTKAAKLCKQAGLYRVQYSVFLGTVDSHEKDTLSLQLEEQIDESQDKVYIFTMSKNELKNASLLGQAFDKKMVTDEIRALFF